MSSRTQPDSRTVAEILEVDSAEFLKQSLERTPNLGAWTKLYAASQTLLSAMRGGQVIAALVEICSNLLGCEHLAILQIERQTGVVHFLGEEGLSPEEREGLIRMEGLLEARITPPSVWVPAASGKSDSPLGVSAVVPLWEDQRFKAAIVLLQLLPQRNGFDLEDQRVLQMLSLFAGPCLRSQIHE